MYQQGGFLRLNKVNHCKKKSIDFLVVFLLPSPLGVVKVRADGCLTDRPDGCFMSMRKVKRRNLMKALEVSFSRHW